MTSAGGGLDPDGASAAVAGAVGAAAPGDAMGAAGATAAGGAALPCGAGGGAGAGPPHAATKSDPIRAAAVRVMPTSRALAPSSGRSQRGVKAPDQVARNPFKQPRISGKIAPDK